MGIEWCSNRVCHTAASASIGTFNSREAYALILETVLLYNEIILLKKFFKKLTEDNLSNIT